MGKPAHQRLLAVIDAETDPKKTVRYVDSLQEAFEDFSRINRWLNALADGGGPNYTERYLREQLMFKYEEDIPMILMQDTHKIDPYFVEWYQSKSGPKGTLPHWKP